MRWISPRVPSIGEDFAVRGSPFRSTSHVEVVRAPRLPARHAHFDHPFAEIQLPRFVGRGAGAPASRLASIGLATALGRAGKMPFSNLCNRRNSRALAEDPTPESACRPPGFDSQRAIFGAASGETHVAAGLSRDLAGPRLTAIQLPATTHTTVRRRLRREERRVRVQARERGCQSVAAFSTATGPVRSRL